MSRIGARWGGAGAFFGTDSFAAAGRLAQAIDELPGVDDYRFDVHVRPGGATVRLMTVVADGRMVRDDVAPSRWTLADAVGDEADQATSMSRR